MKVHISANPSKPLADMLELKSVLAVDLVPSPTHRALWRTDLAGRASAGEPTAPGSGLGTPSPMGFWLSFDGESPLPSSNGRTITFAPWGEDGAELAGSTPKGRSVSWRRPVQTVRVKAPSGGDGDLSLTIGPEGARITTSPATWKAVAEPVLLAICQYWRFAEVDAEIARLTESARGDLDHSNMPGIASLRARGRLVQSARDVRALLLDLPYFEGPLTDPLPYCSTEQAAKTFETLSEKLHLEEWCELIDERAEAVEDAYEALTEKLFEFKNFAWEAVLEGLIILILLAELSLGLYEAFSP